LIAAQSPLLLSCAGEDNARAAPNKIKLSRKTVRARCRASLARSGIRSGIIDEQDFMAD